MASIHDSSLPSAAGSDVLSNFPIELLLSIVSYLPNRDIKSLRSTCRLFHNTARLRLNRVFLSANPLNIRVFRAIADHEIFRKDIVEIIWDDARLIERREIGEEELYDPWMHDWFEINEHEGCPNWFVTTCQENIVDLKSRIYHSRGRWPDDRFETQLPLKICWQYYQNLFQQQEDVLVSKADIEAFKYGLNRFPSLKRVTITPAAHGWCFLPLYETPMIREFPEGFNYPIPRGWPMRAMETVPAYAHPWTELDETERNKWRGFRVITRLLAQEQHNVSEVIVDVKDLCTGINCTIFDQPCEEYNDLLTLLRRPGFSRLDLALLVRGQEHDDWPSFRNGYLRRLIAEADLESFTLRTNVISDTFHEPWRRSQMEDWIPLKTIFPVDKWSRLRHLGLSRFLVRHDDLISLLAKLPETLRSVELSFLTFVDPDDWRGLLTDIRDKLPWKERDVASRPKLIIGIELQDVDPGVGVWMDNEANEFVYADGPNPFENHIHLGSRVGTLRDVFQPELERPNVHWWDKD